MAVNERRVFFILNLESRLTDIKAISKLTLSISNSAEAISLASQLLINSGYQPFSLQKESLALVSDRANYPFGIEILPPKKLIRAVAEYKTDLGIILTSDLSLIPPIFDISLMDAINPRLTLLCNSGGYPDDIWGKWQTLVEPFKKSPEKLQSTGVLYFI